MSLWLDLTGTVSSYLKIGLAGFRLKNVSGNLAVRNTDDTADAEITASKVNASGDTVVINSDAAGSGADWKLSLARPASGMTADVTLTLPANGGSDGQVLKTNGSGVMSWVSAGSTAQCLTLDTTELAFGSGSTISAFTLPANAVVQYVETVIDTAFDDTPSVSVGISGSASKYLSSTQVDLTATAKTVFRVHPGEAASGTSEAIEIAYSAGSATAGAARIIVAYAVPA
jgi:hypothetical protein